jgi:predicted metalloprotease with PDZ domain
MGPGDSFDKEEKYNELLAICSHELFHTWNIKTLRPADMMPYDFTRENHSQLGYVAEGVTTYYGDLCLVRSSIWNLDLWKKSLEDWLNAHHKNFGRFSYSVADSSVDTWLDGYTPGTPWRKVSIYNEGALLSIYLDLQLIIQSEGKYSLDDVMRKLYETKGKLKIGYTADDYWNTLSEFGLANANYIRSTMAESPFDFSEVLRESFEQIGVELTWENSPVSTERVFGFGVDQNGAKTKINLVAPDSAADNAGLWYGDEIIEIDGIGVEKNTAFLLEDRQEADIRFIRNSVPFETKLQALPEHTTIKRSKIDFKQINHPLFKYWVGTRK